MCCGLRAWTVGFHLNGPGASTFISSVKVYYLPIGFISLLENALNFENAYLIHF